MIHPTAIIDPSASLAADVEVGPYSIIGANVEIGAGTVIGSHVVIKGPTRIGERNRIFQFASVGEDCQDKKYQGEPTRLEIGDDNQIRDIVANVNSATADLKNLSSDLNKLTYDKNSSLSLVRDKDFKSRLDNTIKNFEEFSRKIKDNPSLPFFSKPEKPDK